MPLGLVCAYVGTTVPDRSRVMKIEKERETSDGDARYLFQKSRGGS